MLDVRSFESEDKRALSEHLGISAVKSLFLALLSFFSGSLLYPGDPPVTRPISSKAPEDFLRFRARSVVRNGLAFFRYPRNPAR
jgi:hypothetical protein